MHSVLAGCIEPRCATYKGTAGNENQIMGNSLPCLPTLLLNQGLRLSSIELSPFQAMRSERQTWLVVF